MKKLLATTALVGSFAISPAAADPTVSVGLSWSFSGTQAGQLGISGKIISNNRRDEWTAAVGGTYYPSNSTFGIDIGVGYNFRNMPVTLSYDLLNEGINLGVGWANLGEPDAAY